MIRDVDPTFHDFEREVEEWHWWSCGRRHILAALVGEARVPPGARLLDVGCGTGGNSVALAPFGRVVGVDRAVGALTRSADRPLAARVQAEATRLPFGEGSFDVVVALDVLEHLDDDVAGALEMRRVLRPGGLLVVFVPALDILWSYNDDYSHHRRRYTRAQLAAALRGARLEVERLTYFNSLLFLPILGARLLERLVRTGRRYEHETAVPGRANDLAGALFGVEAPWLRRHGFPIGVSLAALARRARA